MSKCKFSIIVAIYNIEKYLGLCIKNLVNQTFKDYEIILVDDGSIDESGVICDKFSLTYNNIKVIHQKNQGLSIARNNGISCAKGEYILFVDGDDFVDLQYLQIIDRNLEKDIDLLIFNFQMVDEEHNILYNKYRVQKNIHGECNNMEGLDLLFSQKIMAYAWNKVYKKELFSNINFPEKRRYEDIAIMYKIFFKSKKIKIIDDVLYNYLSTRNESITNNRIKNDYYDVLNIMFELEEFVSLNNLYIANFEEYMCTLLVSLKLMSINLMTSDYSEKKLIDTKFNFYFKKSKFKNLKNNPYLYKIFLYRYGLLDILVEIKRRLNK